MLNNNIQNNFEMQYLLTTPSNPLSKSFPCPSRAPKKIESSSFSRTFNLNLDEVLGEKGLEKILREEKWRVEKMMKLKRDGVENKMVEVGKDE